MNLQDLKNNRERVIEIINEETSRLNLTQTAKEVMQYLAFQVEFTSLSTVEEFVYDACYYLRPTKKSALRETMGAIANREEDRGNRWNPIAKTWGKATY